MKNRALKSLVLLLVSMVLSTPALARAAAVAAATATPTSGPWPLTVQFNSDQSAGNIVLYHWYFADGYTSEEPNPSHTYNCYGTFPVMLTVTDDGGATSTSTLTITAQQVLYSAGVALSPNVKYHKKTASPIGGLLTGSVTVIDTEGRAVGGATVQAAWATPSGVVTQTVTTDFAGVASFSVDVPKGASGTYSLLVTGITKPDFFFDTSLGYLSATTQI
jgi:PKD repeat protein